MTRSATARDAAEIARIYNEGMEDRLATFETEPRRERDVLGWLDAGHPVVVAEDETGEVVGWASATTYRSRAVYEGVREFSIYVSRDARGGGSGALPWRR